MARRVSYSKQLSRMLRRRSSPMALTLASHCLAAAAPTLVALAMEHMNACHGALILAPVASSDLPFGA
jgi:hypothetical protein